MSQMLPLPPGLGQVDLEDHLHAVLAAVTGLPGDLIRPRWQPRPPTQPGADVTWCAFGVSEDAPEAIQMIQGEDTATLHRQSLLSVLVTVYGPHAAPLARSLRSGLALAPARDLLRVGSLALVEAGRIIAAPEVIGGAWLPRFDLALTLRWGEGVILDSPTLLCGRPTLIPNP